MYTCMYTFFHVKWNASNALSHRKSSIYPCHLVKPVLEKCLFVKYKYRPCCNVWGTHYWKGGGECIYRHYAIPNFLSTINHFVVVKVRHFSFYGLHKFLVFMNIGIRNKKKISVMSHMYVSGHWRESLFLRILRFCEENSKFKQNAHFYYWFQDNRQWREKILEILVSLQYIFF